MLLLLALALLSSIPVEAQCNYSAISIPVQYVGLSNGKAFRGIPIQVGSPPQSFAFVPNPLINNTYVYDTFRSQCDSPNVAECVTTRGGLFDASRSSTYSAVNTVQQALDFPADDRNYAGDWSIKDPAFFKDTLSISSSKVSLGGFPFGAMRNNFSGPYIAQAVLGLGPNSTMLNALKAKGIIGSRSWSYSWGLNGFSANVQSEGNLIIGGYDASKTTGPNYTFPIIRTFACASGLQLTATDMSLNFPNGTETSLFAGLPILRPICLQPDLSLLMNAQAGDFDNFVKFAGLNWNQKRSFGINFFGALFSPTDMYPGDLSIQILQGPKIRIPNSQFILPDVGITSDGSLSANTNVREVLLNRLQETNGNDPVVLGKTFFSGAYLMVNQDTQKFTLWAASPSKTDSKIVAVGSDDSCTTSAVTPSSMPTTSSAGTNIPTGTNPVTNTSTSVPQKAQMSVAVITGIIAGCVAFAAILSGIFCLLWRRKAGKKPVVPPKDSPHSSLDYSEELDSRALRAELPRGQWEPHELLA